MKVKVLPKTEIKTGNRPEKTVKNEAKNEPVMEPKTGIKKNGTESQD